MHTFWVLLILVCDVYFICKVSYNKIYSVKKLKEGRDWQCTLTRNVEGGYWQEEELPEEGTKN